jgi:hypothetical protein
MLDFTTITANPIPDNLANLQKSNSNLNTENKMLSTALTIVAGVIVGYAIYRLIKLYNDDQSDEHIRDSFKFKI